jgi:hypothetical protein
MVAFAAISYITIKNTTVPILVITLITFKDYEVDSIFKYCWKIRGAAFLVHISLCFAGIMDIGPYYMEAQDRMRYTFGYSHPNLAHAELFIIIVYYFLARKGRLKWFEYVAIMALNVGFFLFTDSRTGMLAISMLLLFNILAHFRLYRFFASHIGKYSYIIFAVLTYVLSVNYYNFGFIQKFGTFSSRFQTAYYLQRASSFTLFGRNLHYSTDLGYMNSLFNYGVIFFVVLIVGHTLLLRRAINDKKWFFASLMIVISIYYILEHFSDSVLYSPLWLYFGEMIFDESRTPIIRRVDGDIRIRLPNIKIRRKLR